MADLLRPSVEARPPPGVTFPWIILERQRHRNRLCFSCRKKLCHSGRLLSNAVPPTSGSSPGPGAASSPRTPSDFDVISTSECSDGSIVFRFGYVTEMENNDVEVEEVDKFRVSDEVASKSLSNETRIGLETLHDDTKGSHVSDGSVEKVASERFSGEERRSFDVIEDLNNDQAENSGYSGSDRTLQLDHVARSHPVAEHTTGPPGIVNAEIFAIDPIDYHARAKIDGFHNPSDDTKLGSVASNLIGHEATAQTERVADGLHNSSEDTHSDTGTSYSLEPEASKQTERVPLYKTSKKSCIPVTGHVEDVIIVGSGFNISSTCSHNANDASLVEAATDIEGIPEAEILEEDVSPTPDAERDMSVKEEPHEETSDEYKSNVEQMQKASSPDDDIKPTMKEALSMTTTEEEPTISASLGSNFQVTTTDHFPSVEALNENIELEISGLIDLVADEETSDEHRSTADVEHAPKASSPDDDIKPTMEESLSLTITEEDTTNSASSGSNFQVTTTGHFPSQEDLDENIELEASGLTALVADEPAVDTPSEHLVGKDAEKVEDFPSSTLIGPASLDDKELTVNPATKTFNADDVPSLLALHDDGDISSSEQPVDCEEGSMTTEVSVISKDEPESDESYNKRKEITETEFCLASGAVLLPHPSKVLTGGEDAYFITDRNWLGIADGAVQWSMEGTVTGLYAKELMENCKAIASSLFTDPLDVLARGATESQSAGSSTVLVACFKDQVLRVATIGDSKFIVIRNGVITERSSLMFHEFNFPVQIERGDDAKELAEVYKVLLDEEDVIIAATDGLFDNLYEQEIASITIKSLKAGLGPKDIAELLATRAQSVGRSTCARTPFADAAQAAGYVRFTGGKLDDITVIVSVVQKSSSSRTY